LINFIWPQNAHLLEQLAARKAVVLAMDAVPASAALQKMDAKWQISLVIARCN